MERFWFSSIGGRSFAFSFTADPSDPSLIWKDEPVGDETVTICAAKHSWSEKSADELPKDTHILKV